MFEKIEVDKSFIRMIQDLQLEFIRLKEDYNKYQSEPISKINSESEHKANNLIFRGKEEAFSYSAKKLDDLLTFYNLNR